MYAKRMQKHPARSKGNIMKPFPLHTQLNPMPQFRAVGQNCTFWVILISSHKLNIPTV